MKNKFEKVMIKLGDELLPDVVRVMGSLANVLDKLNPDILKIVLAFL